MDETALRIANTLARRVVDRRGVTTYQILAKEVGWNHPTGRGLGRKLETVLSFCKDNDLPILTVIVCNTGTRSPSEDGLSHMRRYYGEFDLEAEQQKVFEYDWRSVPELDLPGAAHGDIDFSRLFGKRVFAFPENSWAMVGFPREGDRDGALAKMGGRKAYAVYFCSPNNQPDNAGGKAMSDADVARVLGVVELQPQKAMPETHIDPEILQQDREKWGGDRWPWGIAISRAWKFAPPPFTEDALPVTSKLSWEPTNSIVELLPSERATLAQYEREEVPVFGQTAAQIEFIEARKREPSNYVYMMVCDDQEPLRITDAPRNTFLVKIGVTSDPERRLDEITGNHLAVIFGLKFRKYLAHAWPDQERALAIESFAHRWAGEHGLKASGEYFFLTREQYERAANIVRLGKI